MSHDALAECLTHRTISVGGQALKANLNPADAEDCRDALAKHAYGALFRATVQRVNAALASASTKKGGVDYSIGALDIFGFEIFVRNSYRSSTDVRVARQKASKSSGSRRWRPTARSSVEKAGATSECHQASTSRSKRTSSATATSATQAQPHRAQRTTIVRPLITQADVDPVCLRRT